MEARIATMEDIGAVYSLAVAAHAEAPLNYCLLDKAAVVTELARLIGLGATILAVDPNGLIVGVMPITFDHIWYGQRDDKNAWFLAARFIYVLPPARASNAFNVLLEKAREISEEQGLPLSILLDQGADIERKDELMRRKGLRYVGGNWILGDHRHVQEE